jgi:hypothetical protein
MHLFKNQKLIPHSDKNLSEADIVPITFESQKNKEKYQTIKNVKYTVNLFVFPCFTSLMIMLLEVVICCDIILWQLC